MLAAVLVIRIIGHIIYLRKVNLQLLVLLDEYIVGMNRQVPQNSFAPEDSNLRATVAAAGHPNTYFYDRLLLKINKPAQNVCDPLYCQNNCIQSSVTCAKLTENDGLFQLTSECWPRTTNDSRLCGY